MRKAGIGPGWRRSYIVLWEVMYYNDDRLECLLGPLSLEYVSVNVIGDIGLADNS